MNLLNTFPRAAALALLALAAFSPPGARAEWQRDPASLAWLTDGKVTWRFSHDPAHGKPFFNPVAVAGGPSLTNFKPADHPWHYGLWFSWKYINQANYWEENRQTGRAAGATKWSAPIITVQPDGSATLELDVAYTHPSGRVDLSEARLVRISAPGPDGSYTINWSARFTGGPERVVLDRTPMPGEPKGAINGGYAGLGIRLAGAPLGVEFVSAHGAVPPFERDRSRPAAPAVACNFTEEGRAIGGIAVLSDPANAGEDAPWYLINSREMRFLCAAILAPRPRVIEAGGRFELHYRLALRRSAWTPADLRGTYAQWRNLRR